MKSSSKERAPSKPSVSKLTKGYMGFLTGTGKSLSTISSYKGDLELFEKFLREKKRDFYLLAPRDFESYEGWMEKKGLKTNTRRRKILSAKALVKYAVTRKKLKPTNPMLFVRAPDRLERLPWIPKPHEFSRVLEKVNTSTLTGLRNWLVVRLLAETGASLAELCRLRWENCEGRMLSLEEEKKPRKIRLSEETALRMEEWRKKNPGKHVFPGFNRHGITSEKMTPRGVELFFRFLAKSSGYRLLKPKTLRHYCIVDWLRSGIAEKEVLQRLGVHPNYSLALYRKVLEREQNL